MWLSSVQSWFNREIKSPHAKQILTIFKKTFTLQFSVVRKNKSIREKRLRTRAASTVTSPCIAFKPTIHNKWRRVKTCLSPCKDGTVMNYGERKESECWPDLCASLCSPQNKRREKSIWGSELQKHDGTKITDVFFLQFPSYTFLQSLSSTSKWVSTTSAATQNQVGGGRQTEGLENLQMIHQVPP